MTSLLPFATTAHPFPSASFHVPAVASWVHLELPIPLAATSQPSLSVMRFGLKAENVVGLLSEAVGGSILVESPESLPLPALQLGAYTRLSSSSKEGASKAGNTSSNASTPIAELISRSGGVLEAELLHPAGRAISCSWEALEDIASHHLCVQPLLGGEPGAQWPPSLVEAQPWGAAQGSEELWPLSCLSSYEESEGIDLPPISSGSW